MSKFKFIQNKYSVSVIILLALLLTDIILHKGIGRVMLPDNFTSKLVPYTLPVCHSPLINKEKDWVKAVNNIAAIKNITTATNGIEWDVYFDTTKKHFEVYHDSSAPSTLPVDSLLEYYVEQKLQANIWFDFKNLSPHNVEASLKELQRLQNLYSLQQKLIIESSSAKELSYFCKSGYFTCYYVPLFNPYELEESALITTIDAIAKNLKQYPASALSGYYFQYPILKKIFPTYPILTWLNRSEASLVSYFFNRQLKNDSMVKVVLYSSQ